MAVVERGVAEGVVEVDVGVDDVAHLDVAAEASHVVEHLGALDVARPRVDDDGAVAAEHEADVDVPLAVARHEDPVGDLDEAVALGPRSGGRRGGGRGAGLAAGHERGLDVIHVSSRTVPP